MFFQHEFDEGDAYGYRSRATEKKELSSIPVQGI